MQGLMARTGVHRINTRRHRLDTLAGQRQHQPRAVALESCVAVQMTQPLGQMLHVPVKPFACAHRPSYEE